MLASPLYPASSFSPQQNQDAHSQYRPARDLEAFNSLLPPPIEFIEGSSSGLLAVAEGKYTPINVTPKTPKADLQDDTESHPPAPNSSPDRSSSPCKETSLYSGIIDTTWPSTVGVGSGLYNTGNTCFLNSALQCLLHTPPLLRVLISHKKHDPCLVKSGFCMTCNLREVMADSQRKDRPFTPYPITTKLQFIAKHMRRGRQEDSHEFLRYAIDALQKSCLAGHSPKIDPKLAETTWVHKIFGGRLRSRVTCHDCQHPSDTFDSILDLSLDIHDVDSLKDALRKFVTVDCLKGADKYKCENCKKAVIAEKQFTVHDAPLVLTVHLKRFTPMGRKMGHHIRYDDRISLQPVMSEGQYGPSYSLYGVICHAGGGPNSGHYYAYVKASDDRWYEMNDEVVTPMRGAPVSLKSAYILFYVRDKGQALKAAVTTASNHPPIPLKNGVAAGMKKRKSTPSDDEDDGEDIGVKATRPFIGPKLPLPSSQPDLMRQIHNTSDPQADLVKKRIEAASRKPGSALLNLSQYGESEESGKDEEGAKGTNNDESFYENNVPSSPLPPPTSSPLTSPSTIPAAFFYGKSRSEENAKKRKSPDHERDENIMRTPPRAYSSRLNRPKNDRARFSPKKFGNPYSRFSLNNNLKGDRPPPTKKYGSQAKRRPKS